jgi:RNA polymerase sigma-70 factor (ECF subfamily)
MAQDLNMKCQRFYDAKAAQMIVYGRALGLSHAEAEDVLQETFLAVMKLTEAPECLEHYCLRVFRNRALNYRRGWLRRLAREFESRAWFEPGDEPDGREQSAVQGLETLPAEQREVIVLKIWQGCTFEEIAELLAISPNTAAARYRYGLQKLRKHLDVEAYENERTSGDRITGSDPTVSFRTAPNQDLWPAGG